MKKRLRDYGIVIGRGTPGPRNKITDVNGVTVGHCTVDTSRNKTGVTVVMPCRDNPFSRKLTAAVCVRNGYGKSQGLVQIEELGNLETPIALTNTLNVGIVHDALVDYMLKVGEKDNISITSVNPVVGECNDSVLNDIASRAVGKKEVMAAIDSAEEDFEEGDVGAGKGTVCFGLKGGIGSASRILSLGGQRYTVGALVQSNFGSTENLVIGHRPVGRELTDIEPAPVDRGSIMMILATDLPVTDRQLKRMCGRAPVGLARCGSFLGHGSGDIVIGFTTANRVETAGEEAVFPMEMLREELLDKVFPLVAESVEEAVLNSLAMASTVTGYDGTTKYSLTDVYLNRL
ncbi:MAG: P1 family peptidase [Hungatella sp.]|jgi:D-aminopeptidase|nr:P1 family peptidase [Hungatella sp.]